MCTFFESVSNGTLGFQIQTIRIWIEPRFNGFEILFWICPKEQKIYFWIRNPDLDFDQRNAPLAYFDRRYNFLSYFLS